MGGGTECNSSGRRYRRATLSVWLVFWKSEFRFPPPPISTTPHSPTSDFTHLRPGVSGRLSLERLTAPGSQCFLASCIYTINNTCLCWGMKIQQLALPGCTFPGVRATWRHTPLTWRHMSSCARYSSCWAIVLGNIWGELESSRSGRFGRCPIIKETRATHVRIKCTVRNSTCHVIAARDGCTWRLPGKDARMRYHSNRPDTDSCNTLLKE